jgi:hypothetical protein
MESRRMQITYIAKRRPQCHFPLDKIGGLAARPWSREQTQGKSIGKIPCSGVRAEHRLDSFTNAVTKTASHYRENGTRPAPVAAWKDLSSRGKGKSGRPKRATLRLGP